MKRHLIPIFYFLGITLSGIADLPDANGWWKLDEGGGSTAYDSSGNGYDGTIYGTPGWETDYFGTVLNFNGSANQVTVPGYLGIGGSQPRTVCAWIRTSQLSGSILTYGGVVSLGDWLFLLDGNGKLLLGISGGNMISTQVVADGQWHHAAAVLEDSNQDGSMKIEDLRLYIDGQPAAGTYKNPDTEIYTVPGYPVRIGAKRAPDGSLGYYFAGQIHDVRIYDRSLSNEEIYQSFLEQAEPMGIGTPEYPYKISEPNQLIAIGSIPSLENSCFILTNDIIFDPENNPEHIFTKYVIPVFSGIFDGQNHAIHNLRIEVNEPYSRVGFFGYSGGSGVIIKNLHLKNVFIYDNLIEEYNYPYPDPYNYCCMGGLVGKNGHVYDNQHQLPPPPIPGAAIINCSVSGSITGYREVGGLVGYHVGSAILQCRSDCAVSGTYSVGGLCGYKHLGSIKNSFSTGVVSGDPSIYHRDSRFLGGLCGDNSYGSISHCYATGSVFGNSYFGDSYLGGLCGDNYYGTISECYATGSVSGDSYLGGLCGGNNSSISSCYFLNTAGPDNGYGEPLTNYQMKQQISFTDWDFVDEEENGLNEIWRMCVDGVSYPRLSWEFGQKGDFACPDWVGIEDLEAMALNWLTADSDPDFNYACDGSGDGYIGLEELAILSQYWAEPYIDVSVHNLLMGAIEGESNPSPKELIIKNTGGGILEWGIESGEPMPGWLSIDPVSGTLGRGEGQSLTLSADISGLAAGDYAYTFDVADPNAANSPQTVAVNLHIRGLVAYWALNEEAGNTATDSSGNGHDGTLVGFADPNSSWVSGKAGNCLAFDGISNNVKTMTYKGIEGHSSRTVCAWIKTSQLSGGILNYGSAGTGTRWIFFVNENGNLQLGVNGGNIISTQIVTDGQWHHAAAVLDDYNQDGIMKVEDLRLYIDGQLAEGTYTNPDTEISTVLEFPVRIGVIEGPAAGTLGGYFSGLIDEVWLYDVALSAEQIALLAAE